MSYGLYDGDLRHYPHVPFFNLELMKLSTYYKSKREIVNLSAKYIPYMYSHFIVRQDYPFFTRNPYSSKYKNVEYGGRAFDGQKYKPLPQKIEMCPPDIELYSRVESAFRELDRQQTVDLNIMRRAEHVRLSIDGKTINPHWDKQLRHESNAHGLIFHDYDLNAVEGSYNLIKDNLDEIIQNAGGRRIGMKFPAQIYTEKELLKWLELPLLGAFSFLQFNGIILKSYAYELTRLNISNKHIFNVTMNVTAGANYETFITTGIIRLFKTLLDLRREYIVFSLTYDTDFFIDKRWEQVMQLIMEFNKVNFNLINKSQDRQRIVPYNTLFTYIKKATSKPAYYKSAFSKEEIRQIFQFVRENNYELFTLFYEYAGEKIL